MAAQALVDLAAQALSVTDPQDREALDLSFDIITKEGVEGGAAGPGGFQLRVLTPYLKAYRFHQLHPWVVPTVLAAAAAGVIYLLVRK